MGRAHLFGALNIALSTLYSFHSPSLLLLLYFVSFSFTFQKSGFSTRGIAFTLTKYLRWQYFDTQLWQKHFYKNISDDKFWTSNYNNNMSTTYSRRKQSTKYLWQTYLTKYAWWNYRFSDLIMSKNVWKMLVSQIPLWANMHNKTIDSPLS